MDSMKNTDSVFLTDDKLSKKCLEYVKKEKDTYAGIADVSISIVDYASGWKECTQHYKELIEADIKWRNLIDNCTQVLNYSYPKEIRGLSEHKTDIYYDICEELISLTSKEIDWGKNEE